MSPPSRSRVGSDYWDSFYRAPHPELEEPSSFGRWCLGRIADPANTKLFELGFGNGRDALYFARASVKVVACDGSLAAVEQLTRLAAAVPGAARPTFIHQRFEDLNGRYARAFDVAYSRFTLHAVDAEVASGMLRWAWHALRPSGELMIEARSIHGSLYGLGEPAGPDAFIWGGHYRRFVRREALRAELQDIGFQVVFDVESAGLATLGDDDPVVVRVVAVRPG